MTPGGPWQHITNVGALQAHFMYDQMSLPIFVARVNPPQALHSVEALMKAFQHIPQAFKVWFSARWAC